MNRLLISARMVAMELLRNRTAVVLLFVVPTTLYGLIHATTGERPIPYQLGASGPLRQAAERSISLLFMGTTAMCGLLAFVAFVLTARPIRTDRRLVFEGFRPWELLAAKMLVVALTAAVVAAFVTALLLVFFRPDRIAGVWLGFFLAGLLYGLLGVLIGVLSRRDLDGILVILLLVNVDPGWLQNPVFYTHAHHRAVIHWLPAHHPCQVTMLSAFTNESLTAEGLRAAAWLLSCGMLAAAACRWRLGMSRRAARARDPASPR